MAESSVVREGVVAEPRVEKKREECLVDCRSRELDHSSCWATLCRDIMAAVNFLCWAGRGPRVGSYVGASIGRC